MTLSIIVPSYLKSDILKWFFHSLKNQTISYTHEIIILNDGLEDSTEMQCNKYKGKLNIKYIFTGQRNAKKLKWRIPGFALNIGVKQASGKILILTQPDIFLLDNCIDDMVAPILKNKNIITITEGKDDNSEFLKYLRSGSPHKTELEKIYNSNIPSLNTNMPFFMGISKQKYEHMKGYDESFTGYCFDDNDFADRLQEDHSEIIKIDKRIMHMYHPRNAQYRQGLDNRNELWEYNRKIYTKKQQERTSKLKAISLPITKEELDIKIIVEKVELPETIKSKIVEVSAPIALIPAIKTITPGDKTKWHLEQIPKIVHFYWGGEKLPYLRYLSIYSFLKHNPDWEIRFYYPKYRHNKIAWQSKEHQFTFIGKDCYKKLKKLPIKLIEIDFETFGFKNNLSEVYKANYLEYCLLNLVGGAFSDTDIIYFNSMNTLSINNEENRLTDNIFSILWHGHTMGFLLSAPHNEIYSYLLKKVPYYFKQLKDNYQCIGTLLIDQEIGKTVEIISQKFKDLNIINLEPEAIYAYEISKIKQVFEPHDRLLFEKHSIGLHWYGGHQLSMEYLNKINNPNDANSKKVIDKIIRKSLKIGGEK